MPGLPANGIFLSYRRTEAAPYARLLQFQLRERFPNARVFMDVDSIEAGLDFAEVIREAVDSCAILVALIGRQWVTITDDEGHRRLDDPHDYVRLEIKTALERGVRVVPVLVDGAKPPRQQQLPLGLHKLARLNALELSYGRYEYDADRLLDLIQRVLAAGPGSPVHNADAGVPAGLDAGNPRPDGHDHGEAVRKGSEPVRRSPAHATRLVTDAVRIVHSIPEEELRAGALADIAQLLAAADPDRAARLSTDAERIAQSVTEELKGRALAHIAQTLAPADPDRAERIAQSITDEDWSHLRADALAAVASALAPADPDRAERIARSLTTEDSKARALADIAQTLAPADPDRAERIAQSISDGTSEVKVKALANIARTLAPTDPDRAVWLLTDAECIAQSADDDDLVALTAVVSAMATIDPDRAERIAQSITDDSKGRSLANIAQTLAATDPGRAARLLIDAERIAQSIPSELWKAYALAAVVRGLAAIDPDRAELVAQSITDKDWTPFADSKAEALATVANVLAATDPDRAERIAQSITDKRRRAKALVAIAESLE